MWNFPGESDLYYDIIIQVIITIIVKTRCLQMTQNLFFDLTLNQTKCFPGQLGFPKLLYVWLNWLTKQDKAF